MSMELTKRLWEQPTDKGVLAYHIIQSFSPGEATPDQVHEIGCEFAQRFLADRFECTVSTHLDKGHLHNHIVVNSVSYADGKMFRNNFDTYYHGIRQVSDELCRENRLSVIETDGKGKSYDEWLSGQPASLPFVVWYAKMWNRPLQPRIVLTVLSPNCRTWATRSNMARVWNTWPCAIKTLNEIYALTGSTRAFPRQRCGSITANCTACPPKCSRNTGRKTPRKSRNGSPQNYSPLCSGCGIAASCRAGIPRCPALWLATITTAPCCGKPTTARAQSAATFCCVRIFCCSADTSSKRNSYGKTILKLWMNCWPTRKMQKSKSNSLPASAKFCIAKNVSRNVPRGKKKSNP